MPELELCVHCNRSIYEDDKYVITNKDAPKEHWRHALAERHVREEMKKTSAAA
jgi:hypothetical protein